MLSSAPRNLPLTGSTPSMTLSTGKSPDSVGATAVEHEHEIPGHGPTRILALEDGDEAHVPQEVEVELKRGPQECAEERRVRVLRLFRTDYHLSEDKALCMRDWTRGHPDLAAEFVSAAHDVEAEDEARFERYAPLLDLPEDLAPEAAPTSSRRAREPDLAPTPTSPLSPPPPRPTVVALGVCYVPLLLVTCLLAALRTGGAVTWDWAWVLAPVWLPLVLGTIALILASVTLAFLDERDASRRRAS